jgi:hypothetical protein
LWPSAEDKSFIFQACNAFSELSLPVEIELVKGSFRNQESWTEEGSRVWLVSMLKAVFHCPFTGEKMEVEFENWSLRGACLLNLSPEKFAKSLDKELRLILDSRCSMFVSQCDYVKQMVERGQCFYRHIVGPEIQECNFPAGHKGPCSFAK